MSETCPECGFSVITHSVNERLAHQALGRLNIPPAEVLKCPVSDVWHIVPLGGTGQLDMLTEASA